MIHNLLNLEEIDAEMNVGEQWLAPVCRVSEDHGEEMEENMEKGGSHHCLIQCCQVLSPLAKVAFAMLTAIAPNSEVERCVEYCNEDESGDADQHVLEDVILGHCVLLVASADLEEKKMLRESWIGNRDCHRGNSPIDDSN